MKPASAGANSAFWQLSIAPSLTSRNTLYVVERSDAAVALYRQDSLQLAACGDPQQVSTVLAEVRENFARPDRSLLHQPVWAELAALERAHFGPEWGFAWDYYWITEPLPAIPNAELVEFFPAGSVQLQEIADEVYQVLVASNPISDSVANFAKLDWFVLRLSDGAVATVLGAEPRGRELFLHGLGTAPQYRGQGYGGAIMVGAINLALASYHSVQFGVWNWNHSAKRLYRRLGITNPADELIVGRREPFPDLQALAV
ncbi:MAG: GNAT family N-acetyltransferase [Trueperella sp.]|nr:GNAT family N-acetyltransferase [Trueperella sp.]